jgi:hypothetical protein
MVQVSPSPSLSAPVDEAMIIFLRTGEFSGMKKHIVHFPEWWVRSVLGGSRTDRMSRSCEVSMLSASLANEVERDISRIL